MQLKITGHTGAKLAFVKLVKEYAGIGLKEAKELVDELIPYHVNAPAQSHKEVITLDIRSDDKGYYNEAKRSFEELGLTVLPAREEILAGLLDHIPDSDYKFIILYKNIKYMVSEGDYKIQDGKCIINVEEGRRKTRYEEEVSIDGATVTLPMSVVIETYE